MLAGDTTRLKVTDMARKGMLREGDSWRYSRTFQGTILIKKELTVPTIQTFANLSCIHVDQESFALTFHCPPKEDEYIRSGTEPVVIDGVDNPTLLEKRLLDQDGRVPKSKRPNGNAFKSIRIVRGSEDIGSLFDVRMSAFEKLNLSAA